MDDEDVLPLLADHRLEGSPDGTLLVDRGGVVAEIGERPTSLVDAWVEARAGSVDRVRDLYALPAAALDDAR